MKIEFRTLLRNLDGSIIPLGFDAAGIAFGEATLGTVAVEALANPLIDEAGRPKGVSGVEAVRRYKLALKIVDATEPVDISVEDISFIKELIPAKFALPFIVGQSLELLEQSA